MVWTVPVISQVPNRCWEACARMMWTWRHRNLEGYERSAGSYLAVTTGITQAEMDRFYRVLGMRSFTDAKGINILHALKWSPVIFTNVDKVSGHAMVITGYRGGIYTEANPCAIDTIDFETDHVACEGGELSVTKANVEETLGRYIWFW